MDIQRSSSISIEIIGKIRENVGEIHKAKPHKWTRELGLFLSGNKSLLMLLRRTQRQLVENIEFAKEELKGNIEKTDEMQGKLEELKYEKYCIESEVMRIKKSDTQELSCLGIEITGPKSEILKKFEEEYQARNFLKNELTASEYKLTEARNDLAAVESKLNTLIENLKKIQSAGEPLLSLLPIDQV